MSIGRCGPGAAPGRPRGDAGWAGTGGYRGINIPRTPLLCFVVMERRSPTLGSIPLEFREAIRRFWLLREHHLHI
jgi:hypothetical protein